ncbi:MAG: helix-turn-helix domain-containing protein, partial [Armatimonadota bacterium]|nr:helix-turn-helix domain-containing protein [Armatimonadota bacterium]
MKLDTEQREELQRIIRSNKTSIRERGRARILLAADISQCGEDGTTSGKIDQEICQLARSSPATVSRVRQRFVEEGLKAALYHKE